MVAAAHAFKPDLIVCPFLTKRVPDAIWKNTSVPCLVVHPGIEGDRGISALDWALVEGKQEWGVTVLQAVEEMDAGDIWATRTFPVPAGPDQHGATKSWLYQSKVVDAAIDGLYEAIAKFRARIPPKPLNYSDPGVKGTLKRNMKQADRAVDFAADAPAVAKLIRVSGTLGDTGTRVCCPVFVNCARV